MSGFMRVACAASVVLLAAFFVGCASSPAPRDQFYRIAVATPARLPSPRLTGTLEVDRLRAEAIAHGRRMLYREASRPNTILQRAYDHWSDPPGLMLQDVLTRYLDAAGVARTVVTPGIHVASDFLLSGRIARLEHITGSGARVVVELEFTLVAVKGRRLLLQKVYRDERTTSGDDVDAAITAFDQAVAEIFAQLAADIPNG